MVGGGSIVLRDIPPFMLANGNSARLYGLNRRGLARAGMKAAAMAELRRAYRTLYRTGLRTGEAATRLEAQSPSVEVSELLDFLRTSERGLSR
ncbi:MAG: acyl-[acyl-carrier-protein]--UDP-N-acetylglucosamine O-acyltransferase, partial [Marinobacter sp.]